MNARRACVDDGGGGRVRHARGREDEHRRHYGRAPARDPIFHCSSLCRSPEKLTGFFGCLANLLRPVHGAPRHGMPQGRGARDFTSEQFRREIAHPAPHGGRVAGSRSAQGGGGLWQGPMSSAARPRRGTSDCSPARVRPRQARPSRVASRDFTSESFRRVDMRRVGARSTRAALGAGRPTVARHGCGCSARVRPRQARPSRVAPRDFTSERSDVKSCSSRPPRRERGRIAQRTGGGASPAARPRRGTSDCSPARVRPLGAGAAATSAALPLQTRPNRLGAERPKRLVRKSRFPFRPNKAILSFDVQYQRRRT